jgi:predicted nucleotidyltransferase
MEDTARQMPEKVARVVAELARGLKQLYGERYAGLVLYGSYARGDYDEGSDVDLLLVLEGEVNTTQEILRSQEVKWPLSLENDLALSVLPMSRERYEKSGEPLLRNVRREGVEVG